MIIDQLSTEKGFSFDPALLGPHFAAAMDFLKKGDFKALAPGRYAVDGENVFVLMQEYT
ncbi:MAG: YhcH/YjgK/YiaL family protein, partial [Clostridia bacterium]|nr:YhcH/YjgK/YiaL family protein [Clostridia bacterium]